VLVAAAAAGGFQADCRDCVGFSRVGVEVGCAGSGVESFFGEIFSATLAANEMAEPLKNVSVDCLLSVLASLMAFEILDLFTISAPANNHHFKCGAERRLRYQF
jgi:hypothetical protein